MLELEEIIERHIGTHERFANDICAHFDQTAERKQIKRCAQQWLQQPYYNQASRDCGSLPEWNLDDAEGLWVNAKVILSKICHW